MLEELCMQEVSQIVLSKLKGAVIPGQDYQDGEPVLIIKNPGLSNLSFITKLQTASDAQGFIGSAGVVNNIDFTINNGAILYALWAYMYGYEEEVDKNKHSHPKSIKFVEYIIPDKDNKLWLQHKPNKLYFYGITDNGKTLILPENYEVVEYEVEAPISLSGVEKEGKYLYYIESDIVNQSGSYMVSYEYEAQPISITYIKQIRNNIFCSMDVTIDAVNLKNDDKHQVIIHCDKVQIDTELMLSVNDSEKASFTPIRVQSVAEGEGVNKNVATITVI